MNIRFIFFIIFQLTNGSRTTGAGGTLNTSYPANLTPRQIALFKQLYELKQRQYAAKMCNMRFKRYCSSSFKITSH